MTRAAFFASLLTPFLAALPRKQIQNPTWTESNTGEACATMKIYPPIEVSAQGEQIDVLSSWTDPDSGDIIALVSIKKSAPKPDPGLYS